MSREGPGYRAKCLNCDERFRIGEPVLYVEMAGSYVSSLRFLVWHPLCVAAVADTLDTSEQQAIEAMRASLLQTVRPVKTVRPVAT